jgi:putative tryptophan/tyrosine transport system substrate-binding protein
VTRRKLIALLGGAAVVWPRVLRAQQSERVRRVASLMNAQTDNAELQSNLAEFRQRLQQLGWTEGQNVRFDFRGFAGDVSRLSQYASEVVSLSPDVILAAGVPQVKAIQSATRTIPIVFAQAIDPVGAGAVSSLARPGGNATGFTQFEYSLSGKWPELLKEISPGVKRMAVLRDSSTPAGIGQWAVIQAVAPSLGLDFSPIEVRSGTEIEQGVQTIASGPGGGLVVAAGAQAVIHRQLIIAQASRHRLPAIYPYRSFVTGGGLLSYGTNLANQYRQAAGYVDRILRGEKPADLPVQAPTKYELVINLKTAKALGIDVPPTLLARADEVIE